MKKWIVSIIIVAVIALALVLWPTSHALTLGDDTWDVQLGQLQQLDASVPVEKVPVVLSKTQYGFMKEDFEVGYNASSKSFLVQMEDGQYRIDDSIMVGIIKKAEMKESIRMKEVPTITINDKVIDPTKWLWEHEVLTNVWVGDEAENPIRLPFTLTSFDPPLVKTTMVSKDAHYEMNGDAIEEADLLSLANGKYDVTYVVDYDHEGSRGNVRYDLRMTVDRTPRLLVEEYHVAPGDLIVMSFDDIVSEDEITVNGKPFTVHVKEDNKGYALIPISYYEAPGTMELSFYEQKGKVVIEDTYFPIQYLTIDPTVEATTRSDEAYVEYNAKMTPVRAVSSEEKLWEGIFILPCEGPLSTQFGERRYVNNELTSYRHSGLDIAVPKGTPVVAPNHGKVVFSDFLTITGHTVVIDHGQGILSIYYHLSVRDVETGDLVRKGDKIAEVGSTGFSTGPHLHWTMGYYSVNVNPNIFLDETLFPFK